MKGFKTRTTAILLSLVTLAGVGAGVGLISNDTGSNLYITANAATNNKITNDYRFTKYCMQDSNLVSGYIDGKFTFKSITGTKDIIKDKKFVYNSKTGKTDVVIHVNLKKYKNYIAYINGTVTKNGKTSNIKFSIYNHMSYEYKDTYGVGYTSPRSFYYFPDFGECASTVVSSDTSVIRVIKSKNDLGENLYSLKALKTGDAVITATFTKAGVVQLERITVVNGKVYKSNKTIGVNKTWYNTSNFDIQSMEVANKSIVDASVEWSKSKRNYRIKGLKKGSTKVTVWYTNGNRSEITVTVK